MVQPLFTTLSPISPADLPPPVFDEFVINGITYTEDFQDTKVYSYFETGISPTTWIFLNYWPDTISTFNTSFKFNGEITTGTFDTGSTTVSFAIFSDSINNVAYFMQVDGASSITINSAGAVGSVISGAYNINLCPSTEYINLTTCGVALTNFIGSFSVVRDSDQ